MRVLWDDAESAFLAEFTPGEQWAGDLESAKTAGFKTSGPPNWKWLARKAAVLNKLRQNKPASGLTLTEVAFQHYKSINEREEKKAELKKNFQKLKKAADKESKDPEVSGLVELVIPEKGYIDASDLPSSAYQVVVYTPPPSPKDTCFICEEPVYFYEKSGICLWCEREIELENTV
jgi:hypothetical protein